MEICIRRTIKQINIAMNSGRRLSGTMLSMAEANPEQ